MRARPSLVKSAAAAVAFTFGLLAWMAAAPVPAPARRALPAAPIPAAPPRAAIAPTIHRRRGRGRCRLRERTRTERPAGQLSVRRHRRSPRRAHGRPRPGRRPVRDGGLRRVRDSTTARHGAGSARARSPLPATTNTREDPNAVPNGYFRYFGDRVRGPDGLGYYSFNLPRGCAPGRDVCWHVIALSSELCFAGGGCGPADDPGDPGSGNRMYRWLRRDLRSHPDADYPCTLAFWHHPLFSISDGSGETPGTRPLWQLLYEARADVVLNGHSHNYQRWVPQDPFGAHDPVHGIREFVAGTGGASKYPFQTGSAPEPRRIAERRLRDRPARASSHGLFLEMGPCRRPADRFHGCWHRRRVRVSSARRVVAEITAGGAGSVRSRRSGSP